MTAPNGGRRGRATPYILSQLQAASIQSGGSGELVIPQNFGGTGKGKISDAAAINEAIEYCESVRGAAVWMRGQFLAREPIEFKDGVYLFGERFGRTLLGNSGATLFTDDTSLDFLVDFPELVQGGGIVGLNIHGPGQALTSTIGGVRINNQANNIKLEGLWVGGFSDSCIQGGATTADSPTSVTVQDCVLATDSTGRTLTAPVGSLHLHGTDHYIRNVQCNGGPSSALGAGGDENVMYPGQFYRCGAYLNCISSWFWDMNGEFGDVGIYLDELCQGNDFTGTRADVNAGHGWYVRGSRNRMVGCSAMLDGATAFFGGPTITYDGVIHAGAAQQNKWTNFQYLKVAPIATVRYAWNDAVANNYANANTVDTILCDETDVVADIHHAVQPWRSVVGAPAGGTVTQRPPSRRAFGSTWFDTTTRRITVSDGSSWRDLGDEKVGNICTPQLAKGVGGGLQVDHLDGNCTVTGEFYAFTTANGQKLGTPVVAAAACTSAGATATYFFVQTLAPYTPVTVGETYTIGVQSIAETHAATLLLQVLWYDSGGSYLTGTAILAATGGTANNTSTVTDSYWQGIVPPSGAAFAQPLYAFTRVGLTAGETHRMNCIYIVPDAGGVVTGYQEP